MAVVQLSAGKEVALGGSVLFALDRAEVRPRVALSERAKVHVLIRLQYFQHPIAARGKRQSQGTGVVRGLGFVFFCELCFNFLGFNPQILWEDAVFVLLLLILPTGSSTKVTPSTSFA